MIKETKTTWTCPAGPTWTICNDILKQSHVMIGGTTGSGKSTLLHSIMYSALIHSPVRVQFILIDLKGVELRRYRNLPHTIEYADEPDTAVHAIQTAVDIMRHRLNDLKKTDKTMYEGNDIYLIIDEMAVLMQTAKAKVLGPLANIMRLGRATRVHVISATQNPSRTRGGGAPSEIAQNVTASVCLKVRSAIESRAVIGVAGGENILEPGTGLYWSPRGITTEAMPMTNEDDLKARINYWMNAKPSRPQEERTNKWYSRLFS